MEAIQRSRVVLLGASNLTLAFPLVVARLRAVLPGPLEIHAATGHGRSYGRTSRVLVRELPGILECGLWPAIENARPMETFALLSDFGNDLVYGTDVDEIASWIETILGRLTSRATKIVLVRLPLASVHGISPLRFRVARGIFYPTRKVELTSLRDRARSLDARILSLAGSRGVALIEPQPEWYGLDPIHIRRGMRREVWERILSPLSQDGAPGGEDVLQGPERRALRRARPERRRWMGTLEARPQPCAELLDGTTIALY